eukprot:9457413-Alexandrium_andersonii.AAC.1
MLRRMCDAARPTGPHGRMRRRRRPFARRVLRVGGLTRCRDWPATQYRPPLHRYADASCAR